MQKIPLTQDKFAIVDDDDFHYLSRFSWCFYEDKSGNFQAMVVIGKKSIYMQEIIQPAKKGYYLKHRNGNNLDNRKENLEMISLNHRRHIGLKKRLGASKYRGVQRASKNTWRVVIAKDGIRYCIGIFKFNEEKKAALAYNKKAKELYGEFAYQNKVE